MLEGRHCARGKKYQRSPEARGGHKSHPAHCLLEGLSGYPMGLPEASPCHWACPYPRLALARGSVARAPSGTSSLCLSLCLALRPQEQKEGTARSPLISNLCVYMCVFVTVLSTLTNILKLFIMRPCDRGTVLKSTYGKKPKHRQDTPGATQWASIETRAQAQPMGLRATPAGN